MAWQGPLGGVKRLAIGCIKAGKIYVLFVFVFVFYVCCVYLFAGLCGLYGLPRTLGQCKEVGKWIGRGGQILCRGHPDGLLRQNQGKTLSNKQTGGDKDKSHSNRLLAQTKEN